MANPYWNCVNKLLREVLESAMNSRAFNDFRLVGGTSLGLQLGHRISIDIDLFTDAPYDTIDFEAIDKFFNEHFAYVSTNSGLIGMGTSYFVGNHDREAVKVDIYYTDKFIRPIIQEEGIRLAAVEDIIAMKLDVIGRGGRKKDFWDLHELADHYDLRTMIEFHNERYPYSHQKDLIVSKLIDFTFADDDFDPECLKGKHWEIVKLDFAKLVQEISS